METVLAGRYQIVRRLGGGGFGQTFLAHDRHLPGQPICVVKQFQPKATDPGTLEIAKRLFNREAETLYRLGDYDRIPRLLAHFEQENEFYLAQEYVEGHPLDAELIPGQQYSETSVIALLHDILEVLAVVHQQRVIHRDIKPANLMRRDRDGKIVLIDFGAVKEVSSQPHPLGEEHHSSLTVAIGSPGYMPAEQQAFKPHYSSDLYAVGMIGIQALTGLTPRQIPKDEQTGELHIQAIAPQPLSLPGLIPFMEQMVRYDYRQRYVDAAAALQALQALTQAAFNSSPSSTVLMPARSLDARDFATQLPQSSPAPASDSQATESQFSQLLTAATEPKKALETLLAEAVGPIAPLLLKQELLKATDSEELVTNLANRLPSDRRATFHSQASELLQVLTTTITPAAPPESTATVPPQVPHAVPPLDPGFVKRCAQELAKTIGPIATVLVKRAIAQSAALTPAELVDILATHLPTPEAAAAFRRSLLSP